MLVLKKSIFKSSSPFYAAFVALLDQSWGGKSDSELQPIAKAVQMAFQDVNDLRDKYIKGLGEMNEDGVYTMTDALKENQIEFSISMDAVFDCEFDLPIKEPIKLVKRRKSILTPFQAAAVSDIIEIVWPTDDGSELDKIEKK